jgi:hypothetical protein
MPQAKKSKSRQTSSRKKAMSKAGMKQTKGGLIGLLKPGTSSQTSLLPAVQTSLLPAVQGQG